MMNLKGRRALITGATGGIGQKITETIAELGGSLVLVDKPDADFQQLVEQLQSRWATDINCIECDLEDESSRKELISKVQGQYDQLNILVNNAAFVGMSDLEGWVTDFPQQRVDTWRRALEVNLTAVFELSQGFASQLQQGKGGSIINIASIYGVLAPDYALYKGTNMGNPAAYSASKAGVIQLTRWLATTLAPHVRVNSISPGGIARNQPTVFVKRYMDRTPLRRMAIEDDLKGVIALLSTDASAYITAQNLIVDGGWSAW